MTVSEFKANQQEHSAAIAALTDQFELVCKDRDLHKHELNELHIKHGSLKGQYDTLWKNFTDMGSKHEALLAKLAKVEADAKL